MAREIPGGRVRASRNASIRTRHPGISPKRRLTSDPANFILCIRVHHWFPAFGGGKPLTRIFFDPLELLYLDGLLFWLMEQSCHGARCG